MDFNYKLSEKVKVFIEDAKLEEISIGCSDSQVFKIEKLDKTYFIKISSKGNLTSEYEKLKWLNDKFISNAFSKDIIEVYLELLYMII